MSGQRKLAFVTIGATASFNALIRACLETEFLKKLSEYGYTDLVLQYGKEGKSILDEIRPVQQDGTRQCEGVLISGFDFKAEGLAADMKAAKGTSADQQGVVVSHAGSGTILDALRIGVPLVVVPNPSLLDNHQDELAEELSKQGYVVHAKLNSPEGLESAIDASERLRKKHETWPPVNSGEDPRNKRGIAAVMDEEMGYVAWD